MKRIFRFALLAAAFPALPAAFADQPQRAWMEAARAYSEANGGTSLLVLHDGETVFEAYGNGGSAGKRAMLASGTKSFAGAVAAAAVEDGFIAFDEPVALLLPEWKDDPLKSRITPRHLLSLTSGLPGAGRGGPGRAGAPPRGGCRGRRPSPCRRGSSREPASPMARIPSIPSARPCSAGSRPRPEKATSNTWSAAFSNRSASRWNGRPAALTETPNSAEGLR